MKILITGATGFLGKHVLSEVLTDERVKRVYVITRKPRTHPDSRVHVIEGDISTIHTWNCKIPSLDHVIHLAGLYDFTQTMSFNYRQNVIPALNLIDFVRSYQVGKRPLVHFASTYAVGFGSKKRLLEAPLEELPTIRQPYPYTKAVAEKILTDSEIDCRIFRLGVLVGDEATGTIEKIDGPYFVFRLAWSLRQTPLRKFLKNLPLPIENDGMIPLVPVDAAAKVIARSVLEMPKTERLEIFNVAEPTSVNLGELSKDCFATFLPDTRISFLKQDIQNPWVERLLKAQVHITGIPAHALEFGLEPVAVDTSKFLSRFGSNSIPQYQNYRSSLMRGFKNFMEGRHERA